MKPIERAIKEAGGLSRLALRMKVKPQRVSNWRDRGVPADQVLAIESATNGRVSRHDLRPDLYPREAA